MIEWHTSNNNKCFGARGNSAKLSLSICTSFSQLSNFFISLIGNFGVGVSKLKNFYVDIDLDLFLESSRNIAMEMGRKQLKRNNEEQRASVYNFQ